MVGKSDRDRGTRTVAVLTRLLSGAKSEEGGCRTRCSSNISRRKRMGDGDIDIEDGGDVMNGNGKIMYERQKKGRRRHGDRK